METQCIFIAGFKNCFTLGHTCLVWGHNKENAGEYAGIKITFPGLAGFFCLMCRPSHHKLNILTIFMDVQCNYLTNYHSSPDRTG
jgi:hypothetical protein